MKKRRILKMLPTSLCFICLFIISVSAPRPLVIKTASGLVRGKLNNYKNVEYYSYMGIPFAENPTGSLRFMPPVPRNPWSGVLDATTEGKVCPQGEGRYKRHQMSEDCLNLNVFVPEKDYKLLPIAVVLHGGGLCFLSGRSDYLYGPELLLERDIIVIGINYRLGPLGFLSLDIEEASGNAALKDIMLALKWIKQNIQKFGGNPNNVTLIGHSSGATLAHYLMLSNKSEGLFHQAVLASGSSLSPKVFARHPKLVSLLLARELGLKTNNVYEILNYLRKVDVHELITASNNMGIGVGTVLHQWSAFVPTREIESPHAIVTVDPVEFFRKTKKLQMNVTIIAGSVSQEGLTLAPQITYRLSEIEGLRRHPENCIPTNIEYPLRSKRAKGLGRKIGEFYFGERMRNLTLNAVFNLATDMQYVYGVHFWIKQYKSLPDSGPLYYYNFDFDGELNWSKTYYNIRFPGTAHSDDMGYIFLTNSTKSKIDSVDARSLRMLDTMLNQMENFHHHGNPTPDDSAYKWPDCGKNQTFLLISDNVAVKNYSSSVFSERMQFWEKIYNEYYEYIENGGQIQYKIFPL